MFAEHLDIDHRFVDVAELDCVKQAFDAVNDLESPPVAQRENEGEPVVTSGLLNRFVKLLLRTFRQISQATDRLKPNILLDSMDVVVAVQQPPDVTSRFRKTLVRSSDRPRNYSSTP